MFRGCYSYLVKDLYNFDLPSELIAQTPAQPRDSARLLVYRLGDGSITDAVFRDINKFLPPDTTIVLNNSKVEQCRWLFNDSKIEIFVLEKLDTHTIRAMVRPGKKFRLNAKFQIDDWLVAETMAVDAEGIRTIKLNIPHDDERLKKYEHVPLPPYIEQNDSLSSEYQTVYAKPLGSLAAPTAGLHFTEKLLSELRQSHEIEEITLHVGLGTFAKLTDENLRTGKLHQESYYVSETTSKKIKNAKHITAVGTTTVRTLESLSKINYQLSNIKPTDIFIRPGYKFSRVDSMITNFHLPSTSLLMLVASLIADKKSWSEKEAAQELQRIYAHAIKQKYRFYSFGDAMLIV